jgi:hypothetical protein
MGKLCWLRKNKKLILIFGRLTKQMSFCALGECAKIWKKCQKLPCLLIEPKSKIFEYLILHLRYCKLNVPKTISLYCIFDRITSHPLIFKWTVHFSCYCMIISSGILFVLVSSFKPHISNQTKCIIPSTLLLRHPFFMLYNFDSFIPTHYLICGRSGVICGGTGTAGSALAGCRPGRTSPTRGGGRAGPAVNKLSFQLMVGISTDRNTRILL